MAEDAEVESDKACIDISSTYQKYHWDCGIACAQMVLSVVSPSTSLNEEDFDEIRRQLTIGQSVWTIDLARVMHHLKVKHHFFTITLGVDSTYSTVDYYTKRKDEDLFTEEEQRVNNLFSRASEIGIKVEKRSVTKEEIIQHLSGGNPAIVLMDSSILECMASDRKYDIQCNCCIWSSDSTSRHYQGHFIVLCGYSKSRRQIFFKNPDFHRDLCTVSCCCSFENFDASRKSHGTDEDILLVYR